MVFPFPTKPSDDLRALFKYQRLKEHAQDLKHSSIGPGGSLDIVNSSGTVVASFGDVGGAQGVGLRSGGAVQSIEALFADVGRMIDAEGRLDNHVARIGATENVANAVSSEVSGARGGFGNLSGRFDSHASRLGATEGVANGARSELNTARGGFASVGARLNDHVSRIGSLENRADQGVAALAAQIERINTLYQRVNQIREWLNGKPGWPP